MLPGTCQNICVLKYTIHFEQIGLHHPIKLSHKYIKILHQFCQILSYVNNEKL